MLRAPTLLLLALSVALPAPAVADTKAEKAAKKKKDKKAKKDKKKSKADKEQEKADLEAAEAEAAAAEAEANKPETPPDAETDALKTKTDADTEAETAKAKADAEAAEAEKAKEDVAKEPPPPPPAPTGNSVTIGKGRLVIGGSTLNVNLSADAVGKPISIAPSIWYGISSKLSIGVTHDGGTTALTPRPGVRVVTQDILGTPDTTVSGVGICVTGTGDGNCRKVYDNVGADVLIGVADGKLGFAAHVGIDVLSFDPLTLAARIGGLGRYAATSKLSIVFDPRIQIGLTERDSNGESVDVPLWVWFDLSPTLGLYVHTGIAGPFDGFADSFNVPVGVGTSLHAGSRLTLGADFHFSNLLGKNSSADGRVLGARIAVTL